MIIQEKSGRERHVNYKYKMKQKYEKIVTWQSDPKFVAVEEIFLVWWCSKQTINNCKFYGDW